MRPTTSVGPPAANGTTITTGRVGHSSAACVWVIAASGNKLASAATILIFGMVPSPVTGDNVDERAVPALGYSPYGALRHTLHNCWYDFTTTRSTLRLLIHSAASVRSCEARRGFTTTLIASSTRSFAYRSAVGRSSSGNVWVWIFVASKRFCDMNAAARWVALLPSPRMPNR